MIVFCAHSHNLALEEESSVSPQEKESELWPHWSEFRPQAEWSQEEGEVKGLPALVVRSTGAKGVSPGLSACRATHLG